MLTLYEVQYVKDTSQAEAVALASEHRVMLDCSSAERHYGIVIKLQCKEIKPFHQKYSP